jgi:uncharacterized SAM-binding protein YcdF (DUF218 family)
VERRRRFFPLRLALIALVLAVAAYFAAPYWLPWLAKPLIHDDGPAKAEVILVLAGDESGERILRAGDLVKQGYAPLALVSGPFGNYGIYEDQLAIPFAVQHGYPAEWFAGVRNTSRSTRVEAVALVAELRKRRVRNFLVVTSDYHTARARRLYLDAIRKSGGGMTFRMVAAPDVSFRVDSWWREREALKVVFYEYSKTIATALGY